MLFRWAVICVIASRLAAADNCTGAIDALPVPVSHVALAQKIASLAQVACSRAHGSPQLDLVASLRLTQPSGEVVALDDSAFSLPCEAFDRNAGASGVVLPAFGVVVACAAWLLVWLSCSVLCRYDRFAALVLGLDLFVDHDCSQPEGRQIWMWLRLARQQTYNIFAVVLGVWLAMQYQTPGMLFWHFNWQHQIAFASALVHWMVALFEEWSDAGWVSQAYRLHHVAASAVFALCLTTHCMSIVGVVGLLFEIPVVFLDVREALLLQKAMSKLPLERVRSLWDTILIAALLVRGGLLLFYVNSIGRWPLLWGTVLYPGLWHAIFVLFTVLSIGWFCLLIEWRRQDLRQLDLEHAAYSELSKELPQIPAKPTASAIGAPETDVAVQDRRSRAIPYDELTKHANSQSCWVAIDGHVYDVTGFLDEHPGGRAPLLAYAGTDASSAFQAVGHSQAAQARLEEFLLAPVWQLPDDEISSAATKRDSFLDRIRPPSHTGVVTSVMKRAFSGGVGLYALRAVPVERSLSCLLLSFMLCGVMGALFTLIAGTRKRSDATSCMSLSTHVCALAFMATVSSLHLASGEALNVGLVGALFVEALLEPAPRTSLRLWLGWLVFLAYLVPDANNQEASLARSSQLLPGVFLTVSLPVFVRTLPLHVGMKSHRTWAAARLVGLAGIWACMIWSARSVVMVGFPSEWTVSACLGPPSVSLIASLVLSAVTILAGWSLMNAAIEFVALAAPSATSKTILFSVAWLSALAHANTYCGCAAMFGWVLHLRHQARLLEECIRTSGTAVPAYLAAFRFIFDSIRGAVAVGLWFGFMKPAQGLTSLVLPAGLRFFAFGAPLSDLGGRLKLGVCLMLEGEEVEPQHFVCNVGHIPGPAMTDMMMTSAASLDIMDELDTDAPGLVANFLCVVPDANPARCFCDCGWQSMREINISAWQSEAAAQTWYRRSVAHAKILQQHRNRGLKVFGNLLASLSPTRMEWQRRCRMCARVVDGFASDRCSHCPGSTYAIPRF